MSRKFAIEIEDKTYEELLNAYKDINRMMDKSQVSFEQFLADILNQYVLVRSKAQDFYGNLPKDMFDNLDLSKIDEMMSSLKNLGSIFGDPRVKPNESKTTTTKQEDKKSDSNEPPVRKKS